MFRQGLESNGPMSENFCPFLCHQLPAPNDSELNQQEVGQNQHPAPNGADLNEEVERERAEIEELFN